MAKMNAQIGLRATRELKERLTAQARKERVSVSGLILRVLEEYLTSKESEN